MNQLDGNGSERAVIRALHMGFRDFELDVHSDSKYGYGCGSLYVTHGSTSVSNWDLKKGFEVVAKYGFLNRKTPIVISV